MTVARTFALGTVVALAVAVVVVPRVAGRDAACGVPSQQEARAWPEGCWRPYADDSPFNRPIPARPRLDPRSSAIVREITSSPPGAIDAGLHETEQDWGRPLYVSRPDDPVFRVHCTRAWGTCALEGTRIRVPDDAEPAGGRDAHLTVVDPASGWEYDLWKVAYKQPGGGELTAAWGGRTRIDGDGLGSDAVASAFGTLAGLIRPEELEAGRIRHALFMTVPCVAAVDRDDDVYPAIGNARRCTDGQDAPLLGARVQLAMTPAEIDALEVAPWTRTLLRAMAEYGMFVGDTGGPAGWSVQIQSDTSYTSMGGEPRLERFAARAGWRRYVDDDLDRVVYVGDFAPGVDWRSRLRVVDPCVTAGTCAG
ncbi:MAG TPA: hypothetical protein VGW75_06640 [Solirubrobacteraceae bacterium]|nr:hypothetical protein [Solirubrobacteraceae bacterium]